MEHKKGRDTMGASAKKVDMLSGSLFKNIIAFALPFMFTAFIQHLYNAADVMIVGRYAGRESLAGVGTTGSISNLIINFVLGFSVGISVTLGRAIGAKDPDSIHKTVHTAMSMSVICGAAISVIGIVFAEPLLRLIDVPDNVMPQAKIYMQIIFAGKTPSMIYNFGAAILRAYGETKKPMYIVMVSGVINVILNLIFVTQFGMQADGVALATVISQIFTAVAIIYMLIIRTDESKLFLKKIKLYKEQLFDIVKIGLPSGLQSIVFSLSTVLVQSSVNSFGDAVIAGSSAASNLGNFYNAGVNAFYQASVTFVSQNVGAKQYRRIDRIIGWCALDVTFVWIIEVLITLFFGRFLVTLYAPDDPVAVDMGMIRMMCVNCFYGFLGYMNVMCGALRGIGKSTSALISSIAGVCGIRILWIFTVFKKIGTLSSLYICFPLSWLGTFFFHGIMYLKERKKLLSEVPYNQESA